MKNLTNVITAKELRTGLIYFLIQLFLLPVIIVEGNELLGLSLNEAQLSFILFSIDFICITVLFRKFLITGVKNAFQSFIPCLRANVTEIIKDIHFFQLTQLKCALHHYNCWRVVLSCSKLCIFLHSPTLFLL